MNLIEKLVRKILLFRCEKQKEEKCNTSVTDNMSYPEFCRLASKSNTIFRTFKEHSIYTNVLEHTEYETGLEYLKFVNERSDLLRDNLETFAGNELYGGGVKYYYEELGRELSPSTLRYVKVLEEINELFPVSGLKSVAEIGIGYGGQCRLFKCLNADISYYCIDLPQVCMLAKKWLKKNKIEDVAFIDGTSEFEPVECDLIISNYAYSELRRNVQDIYFEKVISRAKHGYITWNTMSERYLDGYSLEEFSSKISNSRLIDEVPLTQEGNAIIIW